MARLTVLPRSLKPGDTAADRRVLAALKVANSAPTQGDRSVGYDTHGQRWLHIEIYLPDVGTSVEWVLHVWSDVSEKWLIDCRPGTAGVVSLAASATDNPQKSVIEIAGAPRVYLELRNMTGVFTQGVDAWLSASSTATHLTPRSC